MPRFLTIPHEPIARFRLLSIWFAAAIAFLNVPLFVFYSNLGEPLRAEAVVAAALLGVWWLYGHHRGGFPTAGWIVDAVLVGFIGAFSPMPIRAIGVFYAGVQCRALYVSRRELPLLALAYTAARIGSLVAAPGAYPYGTLSAISIIQIIALIIIAITLHLFVAATERHATIERALARSDERYRLVAGAMRDVVFDWNVATDAVEWTGSLQHVFGFAPADVGTTLAWWMERIHVDDRSLIERTTAALLADQSSAADTVRYRVRRGDGTFAHVSGSVVVQRAADGTPQRLVGSVRDITGEQQLEEQLRQSQKMEAVGQLAGGVAHDFNNLLTVIGGHVFMLEQTTPPGPKTEKHLAGITQAAERAAALTRQLLAFSRKQILTPSVLNLNAVVDDVLQLMRPVIGEHIRIVTRLDPLLSPVSADAGQLGQVLVNLALNARDAMPSGGTLTIETDNATLAPPDDSAAPSLSPGDYVRLRMTDAGMGMDPQTLARAFEPFFTTKPHGQGTGLGLATVYGIVKQSFGDIQASSTLGVGSTFTILLPVAHRPIERTESRLPEASADDAPPVQHGVLLVEDDDGVRDFAVEVLVRAGYRVRAARNGIDALDQTRATDFAVDVVVTDIVMPEMGGRELAEHLHRRWPSLPILFITGYTDDERMLGALSRSDARLLEKPFTAGALTAAVREAREATGGVPARALL